MTDDLTRQEILFFSTIYILNKGASNDGTYMNEGATENDIFDGMGQLAVQLGWPEYLKAVPRPFDERILDGETRHFIELCKPLTWRVTDSGLKSYVLHLVGRHLNGNDNESARDLLLEKLGSNPPQKKGLTLRHG